ncbi:MAG TPA: hypothetical protein VK481_13210 [Gemmatimonadaceae bacterium]|nr:hypothetical protein [Gemmatimonadaceae bacterium]
MKSVDALLRGLVDYAGLFPPASEDMRPALESYSSYARGEDRPALGRFIVPVSRLGELEELGGDLMPRGKRSEPWRLSVLVAEDVPAASEEMLKFNRRHSPESANGSAVIDVAELKASATDEIRHQRRALSRELTAYFEIPITGEVTPLIKTIAKVGARAKIRTGGVTPEAFPPAEAIVDFIAACQREKVPFKATAGLHHPIRGEYRLTYEPDSPKWMMYGFLNVFLAAALLHMGESEDTARDVLEESDTSAFKFADDAIQWRDKRIGLDQIVASRSEFAISFGSCSFREPVEELADLTRKTR